MQSRVSEMKSALQRARQQPIEAPPDQREPEESEEEDEDSQTNPTNRFKQIMAVERMLRVSAEQKRAQSEEEEQQNIRQKASEEGKKNKIPRAASFIANHLATTLEMSTFGLAFLGTFFIRFLSLGWLNLEMIYGKWIMKGKHKFVPAISWDPLPLSFIDKEGIVLQILVILTDILVLFIMMLPLIIIGILLHLVSKVTDAISTIL